MSEFKKGDMVALKSGSMAMTVESVEGETIHCVWANQGLIGRDAFPIAVLRPHTPHERERRDDRGGKPPYGGGGGGGKPYGGRDNDRGGKPSYGDRDRGGRDNDRGDRGGDRGGHRGKDHDRGGHRAEERGGDARMYSKNRRF